MEYQFMPLQNTLSSAFVKGFKNKLFDVNASYECEFYFQVILYLGGYGLSYQMLVTRLKRLADFGGLISITIRQFHPVC